MIKYCLDLLLIVVSVSVWFFISSTPIYSQEAIEYNEPEVIDQDVPVGETDPFTGEFEQTGSVHMEGTWERPGPGGHFMDVNGNLTTNANQDFSQGILTEVGYVANNTSQSTIDRINGFAKGGNRGRAITEAANCGCWRSTFGSEGEGGPGGGGPDSGGTGKIQGLKVVNGDPGVEPPRSQRVEVVGTGKSSNSNPFFLNDVPSGIRTFAVTVPSGWTVRYTGCYNGVVECHHPENGRDRPQISGTGSSVNVNIRRDQYIDWRWHFSQVCDSNAVGTNRLIGCLWDGTDFNVSDSDAPSGPTLSAPVSDTATALDQNWGQGTPNSFVGNDTFSAKWRGNFTFKAGTYTFYAGADDGVRLKIDGQTKINDWVNTSYRERSAAVTLSAGVHLVELEYFENQGNARASLRWTYTSDADLDLNDAASELQFYAEAARTTPKQSFNPNQTIYARVKTRNGGTGAINVPFRIGFYLNRTTGGSPPCSQTPDPSSAFKAINSLSAGATDTWDFEVNAPSQGGTKIAYAFADYQCQVAETNETNNIRSKTYAVIVNAWFETQGGDTAATGTISVSQQPPGGRYQSSYLLAANSIDPKVQISPTAYRLSSYAHPLVPSSGSVYTYMAERFRQRAIDEGEQRCDIRAGSLPGNKKYAYCSGDAEFNSGNGPNGDQIWFVDGNLTIKKDLTLTAGDLAIFVVKGNIIINTDVKRADGIYITDSTFRDTTDLANTFGPQLVITGGIYGGTVSLSRKLGGADCAPTCDNTLEPAEKVIFDPKYLGRMSPILGSVGVSWLEVNP